MNNHSEPENNTKVRFHIVTTDEAGQRIDNFLLKTLKPAPKSLIYRILRKGEVRINKKRAKPDYKIQIGENIRIPPIKLPEKNSQASIPKHVLERIEQAILKEDNNIIAINKPSGLPVHGGSGSAYGLIEAFRQLRPHIPYVELVHRLDKETSGLILLAKNRQTLNALHALFRREDGEITKNYIALVSGKWQGGKKHVALELQREANKRQKIQVQKGGKHSESIFSPINIFSNASLMKVQILTGRMHQIRTQLAHLGYPIIGDDRYGDFQQNRLFKQYGIKRLFLHAESMQFRLEFSSQNYNLQAALPDDLKQAIKQL